MDLRAIAHVPTTAVITTAFSVLAIPLTRKAVTPILGLAGTKQVTLLATRHITMAMTPMGIAGAEAAVELVIPRTTMAPIRTATTTVRVAISMVATEHALSKENPKKPAPNRL